MPPPPSSPLLQRSGLITACSPVPECLDAEGSEPDDEAVCPPPGKVVAGGAVGNEDGADRRRPVPGPLDVGPAGRLQARIRTEWARPNRGPTARSTTGLPRPPPGTTATLAANPVCSVSRTKNSDLLFAGVDDVVIARGCSRGSTSAVRSPRVSDGRSGGRTPPAGKRSGCGRTSTRFLPLRCGPRRRVRAG